VNKFQAAQANRNTMIRGDANRQPSPSPALNLIAILNSDSVFRVFGYSVIRVFGHSGINFGLSVCS
jgi:hypothetical protein